MKKSYINYDSYSVDNKTYLNVYEEKKNNISLIVRTILFFIVTVLLVTMLYRLAIGKGTLTFSGLLSTLQNLSNVDLPNLVINTIADSWGFFDFFRLTLNMFISILNFGLFIVSGMLSVLQFVLGILGWLML